MRQEILSLGGTASSGVLVDTTERTCVHGHTTDYVSLYNRGSVAIHYKWTTGVTAFASPLTTAGSVGKSMTLESGELAIVPNDGTTLYAICAAGSAELVIRDVNPRGL